MKKFLLILSLSLLASVSLFAQEEEEDGGNEKIRDKMNEYIQKRLDLSDAETKKFSPVFIQYFREWRQAIRDNKGPERKLDRQKKIIDLQLKFRPQFQQILGEKRGGQVFDHQGRFIQELQELRRDRLRNNPRPNKRGG